MELEASEARVVYPGGVPGEAAEELPLFGVYPPQFPEAPFTLQVYEVRDYPVKDWHSIRGEVFGVFLRFELGIFKVFAGEG